MIQYMLPRDLFEDLAKNIGKESADKCLTETWEQKEQRCNF